MNVHKGSAYTRRTKLLARKENESRHPPELPGNYRDMQLRQQLQDQVRDGQTGPERRSLFRMSPVLYRHSEDHGHRRPHRQVPPEIRQQDCGVIISRCSYLKRQRLLPFLFALTMPCQINPDCPLEVFPTVGASLLAKFFASKLAPTVGPWPNGQSGVSCRVDKRDGCT